MNKLYPPQIEGTIPAFTGTTIVVPFAMNKAVNINEIKAIELKVKTVQNDTFLFTVRSSEYKLISGSNYIAKFTIPEDYLNPEFGPSLKLSSFYKLQIAFVHTSGIVGYYSTVGVAKYTTMPKVDIDNLPDPIGLNFLPAELIGIYSQRSYNNEITDTTERVYSYQYQLFDKNRNLIEDTGEKLHNSSIDIRWDESYDSYEIETPLISNEIYFVRYYIKSQNGIIKYSPMYKIIDCLEVLPSDIEGDLAAKNYYDNGYIELTFIDYENAAPLAGTYEVYRCQDDKWELIHKFVSEGGSPSDWVYRDMTIEHGVKYRYGVRQYNTNNNIRSARKELKFVYNWYKEEYEPHEYIRADFEDTFLFDGYRQLAIKYNPKVSSFKTDILEQKTDTIGSRYPFFFRNGNTYYNEFPISGLISYLSDNESLFKSRRELGIDEDTNIRFNTKSDTVSIYTPAREYDPATAYYVKKGVVYNPVGYIEEKDFKPFEYYVITKKPRKDTEFNPATTDLVAYNIKAERQFKMEVLAWLNNGKPKLFRSPGEGNCIVRLMNVSLTPNDTVNRTLHTFNCTAYEVDKYSVANLKKNSIWDDSEENIQLKQMLYATFRSLTEEDKRENNNLFNRVSGYDHLNLMYSVNLIDKLSNAIGPASYVDITDMVPGTQVIINDQTFTIGATGTFRFELEDSITNVVMVDPTRSNNITAEFFDNDAIALDAGQITIGYMGYGVSTFDRYSNMKLTTVPTRQWFGQNKDIYNSYYELSSDGYNSEYTYYVNKNNKFRPVELTTEPGKPNSYIPNNYYLYSKNTMNDIAHEVINIPYARFIKRNIEILYYKGTGLKYNDLKQCVTYGFDNDEMKEHVDSPSYSTIGAFINDLYRSPYDTNPIRSIMDLDPDTLYELRILDAPKATPGPEEPQPVKLSNGKIYNFTWGKDYYIDRKMHTGENIHFDGTTAYQETYYPISGAYLDLRNECLWNNDELQFKVKFYKDDNGTVDLSDTWMVEYTDLEKEDIECIVLGPGVTAEITYNVLEMEYIYDCPEKKMYEDGYQELQDFLSDEENIPDASEYAIREEEVKRREYLYLSALNALNILYKEEFGRG